LEKRRSCLLVKKEKKERKRREKWLGYLYEKITIADGLAFLKRKDTNMLISFQIGTFEHVCVVT